MMYKLSTSRRWWCKTCRQFTWWEFLGDDDDGRCGQHVDLCPSGCGCAPGQADMRDCACDGPCCFDDAWNELPQIPRPGGIADLTAEEVNDYLKEMRG